VEVNVTLYGTLRQKVPDYQHPRGIVVELPDGATVQDLLAHLGISLSQRAVAIAEGRVLKGDDPLPAGIPVRILQAVGGG
jgi:sulfur carrier protein ThiS